MPAAQAQKPQKLPPLRPGDKAPTPRPRDENEDQNRLRKPGPVITIAEVVPEQPYVMIQLKGWKDAKRYDLRLLSEMPIIEQQQMIRMGEEYDALFARDLETQEQRDRLEYLLNEQFHRVLQAPESVKKRCSDYVKSQVVRAFSLAPLHMMAEQMAQQEQSQKPNDENGSESNESSTSES